MRKKSIVFIEGPKEKVNIVCDFFLNNGFVLYSDASSEEEANQYFAPPEIPTEIIVALIGAAGSAIVELIKIIEQRRKEKQKIKIKDNSDGAGTTGIAIKKDSPNTYTFSIDPDTPVEEIKIIFEISSKNS